MNISLQLATIPGIDQGLTTPALTRTSASTEPATKNEPTAPEHNVSQKVTSSVTTLSTDTVDQQSSISVSPLNSTCSGSQKSDEVITESGIHSPTTIDINANPGVRVCDDQRYKKYFKMMQFGVPAPAVKLKMEAEGIDSKLLE